MRESLLNIGEYGYNCYEENCIFSQINAIESISTKIFYLKDLVLIEQQSFYYFYSDFFIEKWYNMVAVIRGK